LGLVFLQTASEELVCPWEDLSISRKEELRRLLLAHMPQVFSMLTGIAHLSYMTLQYHRIVGNTIPATIAIVVRFYCPLLPLRVSVSVWPSSGGIYNYGFWKLLH
jgi:hypothetical protein